MILVFIKLSISFLSLKIEYAKKQQYNPQQDIINRGGSIVLQDYLNEKKEEESSLTFSVNNESIDGSLAPSWIKRVKEVEKEMNN